MKNNKNTPTCFLCNSPLIFVSEETVKPEGYRFPQINTIYKCSNEVCQKTKDQEKEKRLLAKQKKDKSDQQRQDAMQEKKLVKQQEKMKGA